jgi:endonuclease YncB( thermonuclease family)
MRFRIVPSWVGLIAAAAALSAEPVHGQRRRSGECTVERIVDGDTFVCMGGTRVRLLLIDAPELAQRPYGDSARAAARALLPVGEQVRLELDVEVEDPYGRLLAYVFRDSLFVNRELVRRGMAVVSVYPPNVREVETLRAAADSARAEGRGLWRASAFECSPRDYRARRCR